MLKRRLIPCLLWDEGTLVKTRGFGSSRVVGSLARAGQVLSDQDADELVICNISRDAETTALFLKDFYDMCQRVFCPVTAGGNIRTLRDVEDVFHNGADKVLISSDLLGSGLIENVVGRYGGQSVVVAIDVRLVGNEPWVFVHGGAEKSRYSLESCLIRARASGAGEIFVQDIERDGLMVGLNLELAELTRASWENSLVFGGGVGHVSDIEAGFEIGVEAIACGSIFHFSDNNPIRLKASLRNSNLPLKRQIGLF